MPTMHTLLVSTHVPCPSLHLHSRVSSQVLPVSWHVLLPPVLSAGSSTNLCVSSPHPGLPLWCFGFPITPVGLGRYLPFFSVRLEGGFPLLSGCYWLNSRAPSSVPVALCLLDLNSSLVLFLEVLLLLLPIIVRLQLYL